MVKYIRELTEEVEAFKVRNDGPTPVPDWFPSNYEIVKYGVVFETSPEFFEVARWNDIVVKTSDGHFRIYPEKLFNILYKLP